MVRPRMHPSKFFFQLAAHLEGIFPVIRGPRGVFRERADESAVFHAGNIAGVRAGVDNSRARAFR